MIPPKAHEFSSSGKELPEITLVTINILNFLRPMLTRIAISFIFAFVAWKLPRHAVKITVGIVLPIFSIILIGATIPFLQI